MVVLHVQRYNHGGDVVFAASLERVARFLIGLRSRLNEKPIVIGAIENVLQPKYIIVSLKYATPELDRRDQTHILYGVKIMALYMHLQRFLVIK